MSRITQVTPPGNAGSYSYSYSGNPVTLTDPAANQRQTITDALGRLVEVVEPDAATGAFVYETLYQYDVLDNLIQIDQKGNDPNSANWRTRTFVYNSLSQLTSATTPEAGTVGFTYTNFSRVDTRTDARGVVTHYDYDPLHRLTGVSYDVSNAPGVSATSAVNFSYGTDPAQNNNGRLASMTDGTGSESYGYDLLGRIAQVSKEIDGTTYPIGYSYNLAHQLTAITYPSGRVVQHSFDPIGRLNQISSGATNYLSNVAYNGAHQPLAFDYGNGVAASFSYNSKMQLATLRYSKGPASLLDLAYSYTSATHTGNNGQITGITDNTGVEEAGRSVNYTYDAWARLRTAQTTGSPTYPQWGLSWDYDRYGNRLNQNVLAGSAPAPQLTINESTNQITDPGYAYDLSGNLTADGLNTYTYDAENRILEVQQGATVLSTSSYDGSFLRVKKVAGGQTTVYIFSGTKVVAEYVNGTLSKEYLYAGSQLLATLNSSGTPTYHHSDHLSTRVETDSAGNVTRQFGHFPFGEVWYESGTADKWKFTSYERDAESGLDYAIFRYDSSRLGRFLSPDPLAGSIFNPQSLNRYAYVLNDPVNLIDPLGLESQCLEWGEHCYIDENGNWKCERYCKKWQETITVTAQGPGPWPADASQSGRTGTQRISLLGAPCIPLRDLNLGLRTLLKSLSFWSQLSGVTHFAGGQVSITKAKGVGASITQSRLYAADPQGGMAIIDVTTIGAVFGTPAYFAGGQVGTSTYQSVDEFQTPSYGSDALGGEGFAVGGSYQESGGHVTTSASVGYGYGGRLAVAPGNMSVSNVRRICP